MGWLGAIRATGASTDAASSKRSGAVRTADGAGGRIGGSPWIELTLLMVRARWRPGVVHDSRTSAASSVWPLWWRDQCLQLGFQIRKQRLEILGGGLEKMRTRGFCFQKHHPLLAKSRLPFAGNRFKETSRRRLPGLKLPQQLHQRGMFLRCHGGGPAWISSMVQVGSTPRSAPLALNFGEDAAA